MRNLSFATVLLGASILGGCLAGCWSTTAKSEEIGASEEGMTPLDRLIIGRSMDYPADPTMRDRLPEMRASQSVRRAQAWDVVRKVLEPVAIDSSNPSTTPSTLPRFQTWYSKDEVLPIFDRVLRAMPVEDRIAKLRPTPAAIDEAFQWEAERVKSLPGWSEQRLAQRRAELEADGTASLGGNERVLMSPAILNHLYGHYDSIVNCLGQVPAATDAPPTATNFAPCVGEEFPPGAVVVKARWIPDTLPLEAFDTSADALTTTVGAGEWAAATRTATPDANGIYTMRLASGVRMRLAALHIATKELRDWVWITLFWSDTPNADYGFDRPADFAGAFGNYKMCTVVSYDEEDNGPTDPSSPNTLEAAHAATRAFGPKTWCSNPYLEHGPNNAKTNCIGCHQHGGTTLSSQEILEGPNAFANGSRDKARENFPADYLFITSSGLELASLMKAKVDQLSQP